MKISSSSISQDSIDEISLIIERNQSKCCTLKQTISANLPYENNHSYITNQFLFDLSYDLKTVLSILDRLKAHNIHLNKELQTADSTINELNCKLTKAQNDIFSLESTLNEVNRRNSQLATINQNNQTYIDDLLLKMKVNCNCCCKCMSCPQRQYTSFCNDSDYIGKNRSMMSTTYEYDEPSKQYSPLLKENRYYGPDDRKLNFDYDVDNLNYYFGNNSRNGNIGKNIDYQGYRKQTFGNKYGNNSNNYYYPELPLESSQYKSVFGRKGYNEDINDEMKKEIKPEDITNINKNVSNEQQQLIGEGDNKLGEVIDDKVKQEQNEISQQNNQIQIQDQNDQHEQDNNEQQINEHQELPISNEEDDVVDENSQNKINRVQKIVTEAFKDEETVNRIKQKLGDDFETKLTKADVDEEYLDKIEQALIEINQETLEDNNNNNFNNESYNNIPSKKISRRLQIAQNAKSKRQVKSPPKDQMYYKAQLKKEITDKQYHYKEYPRGWTSSKDYFVNNNTGDGKMEKSTFKIPNVPK